MNFFIPLISSILPMKIWWVFAMSNLKWSEFMLVWVYDTEHECLLRENFVAEWDEEENDGRDCRLLRTAGLKLYLIFAWTRSSLNISIMLTFSFAEQSTNPHFQSIFTIDSTTSFVTHHKSSDKSTLLQTTTIGTEGPLLLIIWGYWFQYNLISSSCSSPYLFSETHNFVPRLFIVHGEDQNESIWGTDR